MFGLLGLSFRLASIPYGLVLSYMVDIYLTVDMIKVNIKQTGLPRVNALASHHCERVRSPVSAREIFYRHQVEPVGFLTVPQFLPQ